MRSEAVKKGVERVPSRALFYATGVTRKDWDKPFIGIVSSFTDLIPGHISMRELERSIEKGIHTGGGYAFIYSVPGICDGIAMGHKGMYYSLPSREVIADAIEFVAQAYQLDGLVLLTNCDKINPGMLIAAGRLNIPAIVVTAGPMYSGNYKNIRRSLVRDTFEAVGNYQKGLINEAEIEDLAECACPGPGACQGMYTANTTACVIETMGMSLPGCATALAGMAKKRRIAYESGIQICELVKRDITPRKIITRESIENAIRVDLALGGSTNTCLHIPAIANAAGIKITLELFDKLGKDTPHIANIRPGGEHFMEDLEYAGGIPAVLKVLKSKLNNCDTVSLKTTYQLADEAEIVIPEVIHDIKNAYNPEGGIAVLKGNIAPDGCVVKQSAVSDKMKKFSGKAAVFNCEEDAMKEVMAGNIKPGTVIVIRYEGPKGGPGMREMLSVTAAVCGMGLAECVSLITDGRFSGGTRGPCIGHISPEAKENGVIAIVRDGDEIEINIPERKINLNITEEEIKSRFKCVVHPEKKLEGYLKRYAKLVTSASTGAVFADDLI